MQRDNTTCASIVSAENVLPSVLMRKSSTSESSVMAPTIRVCIVEEPKRLRTPFSLDEIGKKQGLSKEAMREEMRASRLLSSACGLTHEQALEVVEFYGRGVIFDDHIEKLIDEFEVSKAKMDELVSSATSVLS